MTGLRTVELTWTIPPHEDPANYPMMEQAWVARLLVFQHATRVDIKFEFVAPNSGVIEQEDRQAIRDFESQLKTELARVRKTDDVVIDVLEN